MFKLKFFFNYIDFLFLDHHKSWQILQIFLLSFSFELLQQYVDYARILQEFPIADGYFQWIPHRPEIHRFLSESVFGCCLALHVLEQVLGGTTPMQLTLLKHVLHHCSLDRACHSIWKRSKEIQYCQLNVRQNCWITNPIVFQETIAKERVEILCLKVSIETSSGCCHRAYQMSKTGSGHAGMWKEWQK